MSDEINDFATLLSKLGGMVQAILDPSKVDKTGRSNKLTFAASAHYKCMPDAKNGVQGDQLMTKAVFTHLKLPDIVAIKATSGLPAAYNNPAVSQSAHTVEGGQRDAARDVAFYNRVIKHTGCYLTAAAFQMAIFYIRGWLLPQLGLATAQVDLPAVPRDKEEKSDDGKTCWMSNELDNRHGGSVMTMVYHALEAVDVMLAIGEDVGVKRVSNKVADLPRSAFSWTDFNEAMMVLSFSGCGDGKPDQFICDFLLGCIQILGAHGTCDEAGIWRELFAEYVVCPNYAVVTSNVMKHTKATLPISDSNILGSILTLQSVVARGILEQDEDVRDLILPIGSSNSDAKNIVNQHTNSIMTALQDVTGMQAHYWRRQLLHNYLRSDEINRHLLFDQMTYLGDFCSPMLSYSQPAINGTRLGKCEVDLGSSLPVNFTGSYGLDVKPIAGVLSYEVNLHARRDFTNPLTYLDPQTRGMGMLEEMDFDCLKAEPRQFFTSAKLADGSTIEGGDKVGAHLWANNGDVLPSGGELRTVAECTTVLTGATLPAWAESGKYQVSISRYSLVGKVANEGKRKGKTRRDMFELKHSADIGKKEGVRPNSPVPMKAYMEWKGYRRREAAQATVRTASVVRQVVENTLAQLGTKVPSNLKDERKKAEFLADVTQKVKDVVQVVGKMADMHDAVMTEKHSALDAEVQEAVAQVGKKIPSLKVFKTLSTADVVEKDENDNVRVKMNNRYGFFKKNRKWVPAIYLHELSNYYNMCSTVLVEVKQSAEKAHVLLGADEEWDRKWDDIVKTGWAWCDEDRTVEVQKLHQPLAAMIAIIDEALVSVVDATPSAP